MANIGTLTANLKLQSASFLRDMSRASASVATNTAQMRRSMRQIESASRGVERAFGQLRGATAALGIGIAVNKLRDSFTQLETSMQRIVGLVGVSQSGVNAFNKEILAMAPAVGKGPGELADALFFITSAGLRGSAAMETLRMSAKASAAGLGETKSVADAVTSAMNAYATSGLTAAQATDVMVKTVREGKLEASDLSSVLGQVLAVAEGAGIRFDEVGASVAALTRIGIKSAEAVTGLRSVLVALLKETANGQEALKNYGLTYADLRKSIRENGLLQTLIDLRKTIGNNETAMVDIFGRVEAVNTVLALTGANVAQVRGIFDSLADSTGALDSAFAAISATVEQDFNEAFAGFEVSADQLGKTLLPPLADALRAVADNIRDLAAAVGAFVAFKAAGYFIGLATAVAKYGAAVRAAAAAQGVLNAAMLAFPLARVISLAAAAGAALWILKDRTVEIGDVTIRVGDVINAVWTSVWETIKGTVQWFTLLLTGIGKFLTLDFSGGAESLRLSAQALNEAARNIYDAWGKIGRGLPPNVPVAVPTVPGSSAGGAPVGLGEAGGAGGAGADIEGLKKRVAEFQRAGNAIKTDWVAHLVEMKAVNDDFDDSLLDMGRAVRAEVITPTETYAATIDKLGALLRTQSIDTETYTRAMEKAKMTLAESNPIVSALGGAFDGLGRRIADMTASSGNALASLRDIAVRVLADIQGAILQAFVFDPIKKAVLGGIGNLLGGTITGSGSTGFVTGSGDFGTEGFIPRASGGRVEAGGAYWVGERGPEPFFPDTTGTVVSNDNAKKLLAGGKGIVINQSFDFRGAEQGVFAQAHIFKEQIKRETVAEVARQMNEGGALAVASGRR